MDRGVDSFKSLIIKLNTNEVNANPMDRDPYGKSVIPIYNACA
jgi:hypothetical protein